jgi:hypothetical protein
MIKICYGYKIKVAQFKSGFWLNVNHFIISKPQLSVGIPQESCWPLLLLYIMSCPFIGILKKITSSFSVFFIFLVINNFAFVMLSLSKKCTNFLLNKSLQKFLDCSLKDMKKQ